MVGDVIKVSPVLEPLGDDVKLFRSWFPPGKWLDLDSMTALDISDDVGELVEFDATQLTVKKHLKPGSILPVQYNVTRDHVKSLANSTDQLAYTGLNLIINRDDQGYAEGNLYIDDGKTISKQAEKKYEYYKFKWVNKTLQKMWLNDDYNATFSQNLDTIVIGDAEDL